MITREMSMRDAYGGKLVELGAKYPELTVLDSDVSSSTRTVLFAERYPARFFNMGVSEANMVDVAAGMAICGLKPVVNSFAVFLTLKTAEQIRNVVAYNDLPVILVGSYAGLSDSFDGASHQSTEDIALTRAIPGMNIIVPADTVELEQALEQAVEISHPVYIRLCRNPSPVLFDHSVPFEFGRIRVVEEGGDVTIAACGVAVAEAMKAAEILRSQGVSAEILNVSTIKPIDRATLIASVKKTRRILTVEEHSVIGGLGSAVTEVLSKEYPVVSDFLGVEDTFTETGAYDELLEQYGISANAIVEKAVGLISLVANPNNC